MNTLTIAPKAWLFSIVIVSLYTHLFWVGQCAFVVIYLQKRLYTIMNVRAVVVVSLCETVNSVITGIQHSTHCILYLWVSEWMLFNANWAICITLRTSCMQWDGDDNNGVRLVLEQHDWLICYSSISLKQQSTSKHVETIRTNQALLLHFNISCLSEKQHKTTHTLPHSLWTR